MKLFAWIFLLGMCLNLAVASETETLDLSNSDTVSLESDEESSEPKFTNLVKSTMDLLGPAEEMEEVSKNEVNSEQSITQSQIED